MSWSCVWGMQGLEATIVPVVEGPMDETFFPTDTEDTLRIRSDTELAKVLL